MPSIHPLTHRAHQHRVEAKYNVVTEYPNLRLHGAAAKGDIGLVQYALTHGQPANSVLDGILPLHAACSGGNELVVKLLIDYGADVNAPRLPRRYTDKKTEGGTIIGSSGSTPLHFAAANGHANIVKILLQQGADPSRADKHGMKPETLAVNMGHDEVAAILREWEISHPTEHSVAGSSTTAPVADGPPSPSRSRRLQMKRSLENLLTRKGHGMTPAHSSPAGSQTLAPDPFASFTGSITPSTPPDLFGASASSTRRPSLPQIFERSPGPPPSPNKKTSHRPRSAGGEGEGEGSGSASSVGHGTVPHSRRLASKISLLNIFKKSDHHHPAIGGGNYGASSPNLLEFLSQPAEIPSTRPRSSIEEARMAVNPRLSLERERNVHPPSAPADRTLFFGPAGEDNEPIAPLPPFTSRTSRSNSGSRTGYGPDFRARVDSNATVASSVSSLDPNQPVSYVVPVNFQSRSGPRNQRDRSASEGAGGLGKRSPLTMSEWLRDEDGNVIKRDLPGVIADDDDGSSASGERTTTASPERIIERPLRAPPPSLPASRIPSTGSSVGHNRTNSSQSVKNLRFDLSSTQPSAASRSPTSPSTPNFGPSHSPVRHASPGSPTNSILARGSSQRALRSSSSFDQLKDGFEADNGTSAPGTTRSSVETEKPTGLHDEEFIEADEAGDSLGEALWDTPGRNGYSRTGSMNGGYTRPNISTITSPSTPVPPSATSTFFSPMTATTTSSGGRPWAYPESVNTSQTSLATPGGSSKYATLSPTGSNTSPAHVGEVDQRLRGASISSAKSTDTTSTSSANVATTTSSSTGASDSSGQRPNWSTSSSTVSVGTKNSAVRPTKLGPITTSGSYRPPYEVEDDDSSSDDKLSKKTVPLPVLIRTVNSHAQAHALVEKAQKDILNLADLPPDSAGLTSEYLSAQLAAYGETLALERRFAKGEAQKAAWVNRRGLEDDSDDEDAEDGDWGEGKSQRTEAFPPPAHRKTSFGTLGNGRPTSPPLHEAPSMEFAGIKGQRSKTLGRPKPARAKIPIKSLTTPAPISTPMRTTPSNVGPPVADLKTTRKGGDDAHALSNLVLHGIEITKTLPTPTDSPQSNLDLAAAQAAPRDVGVDEATELPPVDSAAPSTPQTAPPQSQTPAVIVSDIAPVPLSRVSTAPSSNEKTASAHGRHSSIGHETVVTGPSDYIPPRSESRTAKRFGGLRGLVQTLKGKN